MYKTLLKPIELKERNELEMFRRRHGDATDRETQLPVMSCKCLGCSSALRPAVWLNNQHEVEDAGGVGESWMMRERERHTNVRSEFK